MPHGNEIVRRIFVLIIYLLFHNIMYLLPSPFAMFACTDYSDSGHRPPDYKVTNYVISKICHVMQSEFARVPKRGDPGYEIGVQTDCNLSCTVQIKQTTGLRC